MASHHASDLDSGANSLASSPRSDHPTTDLQPRVRFMCSFGGKILPRPHDNLLRYVGGDTRMVALHRSSSFSSLISKLSKLSGISDVRVKYQLPNEDLDALISVTTDEDVENMMEEYDRVVQNQNPKSARPRLFLFTKGEDISRTSSISSLLDGSTNRSHWFFDALNSGGLERGRSEASSILSEVPDYLFGLDNADDPHNKLKHRPGLPDNVSASDPGSPATLVSSPYCSTSSVVPELPPVKTKPDAPVQFVPTMPDLPPVKTKPDVPVQLEISQIESEVYMPQPVGYPGSTVWNYPTPGSHYPGPAVQQMPVYYVPGPVGTGNIQVQQQPINPYVQQYHQHQAQPGQVPMGYGPPVQGYGGVVRPVAGLDPYSMAAARVVPVPVPEGVSPPVYYGVRNPGMVPAYSGLVVSGGEEIQVTNMDPKLNRVNQLS